MTTRRRLWAKLDEILNGGFSGQITLNCQHGVVLRVEWQRAVTGKREPRGILFAASMDAAT